MDYKSVLELPVDTFMFMEKNSFIEDCMKTQEGRNYLKKCERMNTTKASKSALQLLQGG